MARADSGVRCAVAGQAVRPEGDGGLRGALPSRRGKGGVDPGRRSRDLGAPGPGRTSRPRPQAHRPLGLRPPASLHATGSFGASYTRKKSPINPFPKGVSRCPTFAPRDAQGQPRLDRSFPGRDVSAESIVPAPGPGHAVPNSPGLLPLAWTDALPSRWLRWEEGRPGGCVAKCLRRSCPWALHVPEGQRQGGCRGRHRTPREVFRILTAFRTAWWRIREVASADAAGIGPDSWGPWPDDGPASTPPGRSGDGRPIRPLRPLSLWSSLPAFPASPSQNLNPEIPP
jgi:hypothetical protein